MGDAHWDGTRGYRAAEFGKKVLSQRWNEHHYSSLYLTMRDGTKIAMDVHVPAEWAPGSKKKLPCVLHTTRYGRSMEFRWAWAKWFGFPRVDPINQRFKHLFVAAGYAVVSFDARGSGASFGHRQHGPWTEDELSDFPQVLAWVTGQEWSNGDVGLYGISYDGTTALHNLAHHLPAVKCCTPLFSFHDLYKDISYVGGITMKVFTKFWAEFNRHVDNNTVGSSSWFAWAFVRSVSRVLDDPAGELLAQAVAEHAANWDPVEQSGVVECVDDVNPVLGRSLVDVSPASKSAQILAAQVPTYVVTGWLDASCESAIAQFREIGAAKLVIGPWNHGGIQYVRAFHATTFAKFNLMRETLRFLDAHLKGDDPTGLIAENPVHYFVMGDRPRWESSKVWPPRGRALRVLFLGEDGQMVDSAPEQDGEERVDEHVVDTNAGLKGSTRWSSIAQVFDKIKYTNLGTLDQIVYSVPAQEEPYMVCGHASVTLWVSTPDHDDVDLFVYLLDENPRGRVGYVTEGLFRCSHRKRSDKEGATGGVGAGASSPSSVVEPLPDHSFYRGDKQPMERGVPHEVSFKLLSIAYEVAPGHKLQLCLGGSDAHSFTSKNEDGQRIRLHSSKERPSRLYLPVLKV